MKLIIITIIAFLLIFWIQTTDKHRFKHDKKHKKNIFDKIKIPLLATCLIILALKCSESKQSPSIIAPTDNLMSSQVTDQEIFMGQPEF